METGGQWVGDSFFNRETNLLVASKKELFDDTIGESRAIETYYSDYKIGRWIEFAMSIRMVVDGQTTAKIRVTEVKFMDEIDESVFAKPVAENENARDNNGCSKAIIGSCVRFAHHVN